MNFHPFYVHSPTKMGPSIVECCPKLANIIGKVVNAVPQAPPENTEYIMDGMAVVQMTRSGGVTTLSAKYFSIFSSLLSTRKCNCIHVVFNQYARSW